MSETSLLNFRSEKFADNSTGFVGEYGESLAVEFLKSNGYRIILANFKIPIGRNIRGAQVSGEIDIVALDQNVVCFVEVKTRTSDEFASPLSAVDLRKQRQITRTARIYRKVFNLHKYPFRYDVVGIVLGTGENPQIALYKNFWNESKFRKKVWNDERW
ncbi:MAG: YraN family protein [Pyrinomonadaceae bacterium]|nr:YraN family protein [Pyrinomonadaceae bacterium]